MLATDLVMSLSCSSITSEDFKVVTAYKNQKLVQFLDDNFGCNASSVDFRMPTVSYKHDYLCIYNNVMLATPDGKSVLKPDATVILEDNSHVELYKFN